MTSDQLLMTKVILDRREAIRQAIRDAAPGDTVIVTGMGAQPWFMARDKKISWDEPRIVREELVRLNNVSSIMNQGLDETLAGHDS